jgi:signal transduction histidine kinase
MQLRQLTKHMDHLRENERIHIAREIHDELGQQLTVLKMNIAWLQSNNTVNDEEHNQRISNMLSLSENTINTIRKIAYNLRPQIIEDLGIAEALKLYSKEFQNQTGISVNFFTEIDNLDLSFDTSTALYRIYQESLTNVARYAEASVVNASLDLNERELVLSVSDNGKGFNVADLKKRKSLGVIGMRERAGMIGGHFSIHSEPGEGTHVQVSVDLENDL